MSLAFGLAHPHWFQLSGKFNPLSLFSAGEQGIAVPDLTPGNGFLFQDSAGTTPVTAFEQPVGRIVDRSGRGNHIIQATSTKRPTLSARYNLLTRTEEFDNAAWDMPINTSVSSNVVATTDPLGGNTADKLIENNINNFHWRQQRLLLDMTSINFVGVIHVKAAERYRGRVYFVASADAYPDAGVDFNLQAKTITPYSSATGVLQSSSIAELTNGWFRITIVGRTGVNVAANGLAVMILDNSGNLSYQGDGASGFYIWGADLRRTIDTIGMPAYQRVGASNDYDTAGFFPYLAFDGTDDSMATAATVDFTGTDKMTVFAGVTKLSDAIQVINELSANSDQDVGSFYLANVSPSTLRHQVAGTPNAGARAYGETTLAILSTSVVTQQFNIAGTSVATEIAVRQNGVSQTLATPTGSAGTGNFGNYPLFIGSRNNTNFAFNGRMYPFFIRGAATDATTIAQVEQYIRARMPVSF